MIERLNGRYPDVLFWLGLPCVAFVLFLATAGTTWHQFAIGLLAASVSLLVTMGIFECVFLIVRAALDQRENNDSSGDKPPSSWR
jgi:hypothetical protein